MPLSSIFLGSDYARLVIEQAVAECHDAHAAGAQHPEHLRKDPLRLLQVLRDRACLSVGNNSDVVTSAIWRVGMPLALSPRSLCSMPALASRANCVCRSFWLHDATMGSTCLL